MLLELALSLFTAARGVLAAFGCLCIITHAVVPCLVALGEWLTYELPLEIANWKLVKAQQAELQELEDRLAVLKKRRARQKRVELLRAREDYQTQARRREEAQRRRQSQIKQHSATDEEEQHVRQRVPPQAPSTRPSASQAAPATTSDKPLARTRRPTRPLQLLSPNVPLDRRPVSAYAKASTGVTNKPTDDHDRSHCGASSKSRVLSLGNIFEDAENENAAAKPRMWAH